MLSWMAKKVSGSTPAIVALARERVEYVLHEYPHRDGVTDYGAEAARELGVDPARIFKTLLAEVDGAMTVAVVPVVGRLDLKLLAAACGGKRARMADGAVAEKKSGYVLGGVSPLGQRTVSPTVLDASAKAFETVYVSAGKRGLDIELRPSDLLRVTRGIWGAIARL